MIKRKDRYLYCKFVTHQITQVKEQFKELHNNMVVKEEQGIKKQKCL